MKLGSRTTKLCHTSRLVRTMKTKNEAGVATPTRKERKLRAMISNRLSCVLSSLSFLRNHSTTSNLTLLAFTCRRKAASANLVWVRGSEVTLLDSCLWLASSSSLKGLPDGTAFQSAPEASKTLKMVPLGGFKLS